MQTKETATAAGLTSAEAQRRLATLGPNEVLEPPPHALLTFARRFWGPVAWMLEAAGISTASLAGIVAVKLTAAAYLATLRGWLRDDTPDLAPTMAALDRRLRGIERWYGSAGHGTTTRRA